MEPSPGTAGTVPCPFCQQPVRRDALTCRWCGEAIVSQAGPGAPPKPAPPAGPKPPPPGGPATPARVILRPLTVLQILDGSFRLYRDNFFLFLGIMAVAYAPMVILVMAMFGLMFTAGGMRSGNASLPVNAGVVGAQAQPAPDPATLMALCFVVVLMMAVTFIAVPIANGALARAVSDRYLGRRGTVGSSYRAVLRIIFSYLLTLFLAFLLLMVGFVPAVCVGYGAIIGMVMGQPAVGIAGLVLFLPALIPGFVLYAMFYSFTAQIMVIEGQVGTDALGRCMRLSQGHRWRIIGLLAVSVIVGWLLGLAISFTCQIVLRRVIESDMMRTLLEQGASNIIGMLLQPLWGVAWVLLYYDVRIRKEGFDLQLLAQRLT